MAAAVKVLDRDGVEGLSMRTLAQELDTAATSLYSHVHNKGELLDLAVDALMGEVAAARRDGLADGDAKGRRSTCGPS